MDQHIPLKRDRKQGGQREQGRADDGREEGFDPAPHREEEEDRYRRDEVLGKGFPGGERDTIAETTAFTNLPRQVGVTGKKGEKDDQQQEQPPEQAHLPAQQYGNAGHDLEQDHDDGEDKREMV